MRGNQKVQQLGYKELTYYMTHNVIFQHSPAKSTNFSTLLLSFYASKIEFSVLTLKPCLNSDLHFIVYKPGSTKTVLQLSYQEITTGSQV